MIIWRQITKLKFSALIFITLCLSPYLKSYVRNGPSIITAVFRIIKDRKKFSIFLSYAPNSVAFSRHIWIEIEISSKAVF